MMSIFPIIPRPAPFLEMLFGEKVGVTAGALTEEQMRLAEKFREGMASALGVPPEAIRQEPIERWVISWTRAFVKPEYWAEMNWSALEGVMGEFGRALGQVLKEVK